MHGARALAPLHLPLPPMPEPAPTAPAPTIRLRRSAERHYEDFGWADNRITFSFAGYRDPDWVHFGPLRVMVENVIQPRQGFPPHPHRDVEILTYVVSGVLTHEDSFGHRAEIGAGEMQLISAGARGMVHSEVNAHDAPEHNYQMWLVPDRPGTPFAYHQRAFPLAERQGRLRLYVHPDGEDGAMPIHTDARVYAGLFAAGDALTHALEPGRGAWLQVVRGRVAVDGAGSEPLVLEAGDGAGIEGAEALALRVAADAEILLFDVRMDVPLLWV